MTVLNVIEPFISYNIPTKCEPHNRAMLCLLIFSFLRSHSNRARENCSTVTSSSFITLGSIGSDISFSKRKKRKKKNKGVHCTFMTVVDMHVLLVRENMFMEQGIEHLHSL